MACFQKSFEVPYLIVEKFEGWRASNSRAGKGIGGLQFKHTDSRARIFSAMLYNLVL